MNEKKEDEPKGYAGEPSNGLIPIIADEYFPKEDDIHDYFMNHPDDLPRTKYIRLIEEFLKDLEELEKKWEDKLK